jgi:hypothetical protein
VISRCCVLVGIPADRLPTGIAADVLIDFVTRTYPGHVAPEIIKAFEMAVNRQFHDVNYDELLKHYGTFSAEYLGRIMAVYNDQERSKVLALQQNIKPLYKEPVFDLVASYELGFFQKYDKLCNENTFEWNEVESRIYYDSLKTLNVLVDTKEQRSAFGLEARTITPKYKPTALQRPESDEDHNRRIVKVAKYLSFKNWIQEQAIELVDLRAVIIPLLKPE